MYIVGAGPGDPGLMPARALELIATADAILYDRLIPPTALDGARPDAELVFVGKERGSDTFSQDEIERMLVQRALAGLHVVRLKGGDPFVFGRGAEEARAALRAGVPFEVVPGVTAGIAAPACAGIPVTHRELSSGVAFVTGHGDHDRPEHTLDWAAVAAFPGTLVLYMPVLQLARSTDALLNAGRPADEPAAIVERGTMPGQRCVTGTLETIARRAAEEGVRPPAVAIFGPVAALAGELAWLAPGALSGRTVAVTRAREQAGELAARLRSLGATVVEAPAISIRPIEDVSLPELGDFDVVCCTSPNGARLLLERMADAGLDARALAGTRVAAVGPGTAAALSERGLRADVLARRSIAEGLHEQLADIPLSRALIAGPAQSRPALRDGLRARGCDVVELALYETVAAPLDDRARAALTRADYVTFTSSSTARFFVEAGARLGENTRLVSIGPETTATMRQLALDVHVEAERHDLDGLVAALLSDASR